MKRKTHIALVLALLVGILGCSPNESMPPVNEVNGNNNDTTPTVTVVDMPEVDGLLGPETEPDTPVTGETLEPETDADTPDSEEVLAPEPEPQLPPPESRLNMIPD